MSRTLVSWIALATIAVAGCGAGSREKPSRIFITIATGGTGGTYYPLGGTLAQIWSTTVPGVNASAQATVASVFNVQAVEQGKADVAFVQGDVAYFAYNQGTPAVPAPHTKLRAMAVLYTNTVQILARRDSDIHRIEDFRGRRIGVGAPGSGTEVVAKIIIEAHGLKYEDVRVDFLSFNEVSAQMQDRTLDGGFISASYPVSAITDVNMSVGVRLISLDPGAVAQIRSQYPFLKPMVIPRDVYNGQDQDIQTIGMDNLLICREELSEDLVYRLTKAFFDGLPQLVAVHVAAKAIDPEQGPSAPLPLHPGAARYYRERELVR